MHRASWTVLFALTACVPNAGVNVESARVPTPVAGARTGGVLRVGITPPDGIDPTSAHEPSGELIAATMCDQLIAFDPVTGDPRPSLAASWTVTDGGKSVFVRLRPDARFSDGTPVTADDVQFTLSRLANERYASPSASLIDRIAGFEFVNGTADVDDEHLRQTLLGVTTVDASTVAIYFSEPASDLFRVLGHPATSPVPRRLVEADPDGFAKRPVCAGPYKLAAAPVPGAPIALERIEGYAGANATLSRRGAGYADRIEFHPYASSTAAVRAFRASKVDLAPVPEAGVRPAGARLALAPALQTEFVGFPTTKPPFNDARVRTALSMALDRETIAARVFNGRRVPARTAIPGALLAGQTPCVQPRADAEGARRLLAEAGVDASKLPATFTFDDEFSNRALVAEIARQWRAALGLRVTMVPLAWERYLALATRPQGLDGIFRFGWAPPYPSAQEILAPLFTVGGVGKDNWSLYSSRDLSEALRRAKEAAEPVARAGYERGAATILCRDMPMIPLLQARRAFAIRDTLQSAVGRDTGVVDGEPLLRELFVSR